MNQEQGLDRSTLIGILLITLIMGLWLVYFQPPVPPPEAEGPAPQAEEQPEEVAPDPFDERAARITPLDTALVASAVGTERLVTVDHPNYVATFSTRGATLTSFVLKDYDRAGIDNGAVEMISDTLGAIAISFTPAQGGQIDTRALYFSTAEESDLVTVGEDGTQLAFEAGIGQGALRFVYNFEPDSYELSLRIEEVNTDILSAAGGYDFIWDGAIPFAEADIREEAQGSGVFARSGGEIETLRLTRQPEVAQRLSGNVDWVAVKNKYFVALMAPRQMVEGAEIEGWRQAEVGDIDYAENYSTRILMPRPRGEANEFGLYLGPMDMRYIGDVAPGVYRMVEYGFGAFITRPLAEFVIGPLFRLLGGFIPSYGLVIILFAAMVKMAVYPLTKVSYKNTARMREMQPKLEAIKEKHADDPQKQQEAMLKMYRETGINPLAGCLPLLLQYPIIIALWRYFQNSIIIRQESFLWAADLSAPDPILHLPFSIPLYGDFVAGFTLIMGLAMVVQMRVAMPPSTGGMQAKIFMYVLPLVLFVVFNRLASGLSLYYLVFNVLTIVQQRMINRQVEEQGVEETKPKKKRIQPGNRKAPQKKGKGKAPRQLAGARKRS